MELVLVAQLVIYQPRGSHSSDCDSVRPRVDSKGRCIKTTIVGLGLSSPEDLEVNVFMLATS